MTNEHTSLEKYTSHTFFSKGLRKGCERVDIGYVWEVSWRRRQTATYWPQVPLTIAVLLPHPAALLNRGPEGSSPLFVAGSHSTGNCDRNWTATRTPTNPSRLWYLVIQLFNIHLLPVGVASAFTGQGDIPISSTGCTRFLIDSSVEGQYVTLVRIVFQ